MPAKSRAARAPGRPRLGRRTAAWPRRGGGPAPFTHPGWWWSRS